MKFDLKDYAEYIPQKEHAAPAGYNHRMRVFVEVTGVPRWNKQLAYIVPKEALKDPREARARELIADVYAKGGFCNTADKVRGSKAGPEINNLIEELAKLLKD